MRGRLFKFGVPLFVFAAGALAPQVGQAGPDGSPIGPGQTFAGRVNGGKSVDSGGNGSAIFVDCAPAATGGTPHPGQTVGVELGGFGKTGTGTTIKAVFVNSIPKTKITFTNYVDVPIPTSFDLPCGGNGSVKFKSPPRSNVTRRRDTVSVVYVRVAS